MAGELDVEKVVQLVTDVSVQLTKAKFGAFFYNVLDGAGRLDEGVHLLSKPYTREALARKIRQVLGSNPQATPDTPVRTQTLPAKNDADTLRSDPVQLTVLPVEDDDLIRVNTAEILQEMGHLVIEAANADEALAALNTTAIDVLLTDLGLPGISGAELSFQARSIDPNIKIIIASGKNEVPQGLDGAVLLRKPFDHSELAEALKQVFASAS